MKSEILFFVAVILLSSVAATEATPFGVVREGGFQLVKIADVLVNEDGELNVNPTDNLNTTNIDYAGVQTDSVFLSPSANKSLQIHEVFVSTESKIVDVLLEFEGSGIPIFKLYTTNFQTGISQVLRLTGETNEKVNITCDANTFVSVTYHEVN